MANTNKRNVIYKKERQYPIFTNITLQKVQN